MLWCLLKVTGLELLKGKRWMWYSLCSHSTVFCVFTHVASICANLLKQKKVFTQEKSSIPTGVFLYFHEFFFCYELHFCTHWPLWTRRKNTKKKEKKTKHIYIADSHNYILIKKKERNTPQNILLYLREKLIKINNKWRERRKDRTLITFIFAPFHIVGLQLNVT